MKRDQDPCVYVGNIFLGGNASICGCVSRPWAPFFKRVSGFTPKINHFEGLCLGRAFTFFSPRYLVKL